MSVLLEDLVRSIELWLKLLKKPEPYVDPNLDPVLLVPGIAGSILQAVDEKGKEERVWVRIFGSDREFCTKLWSRFDPKSGKSVSLDEKTNIVVPQDRDGLYAIDVLDPDMIIGRDGVNYFHDMIVEMTKWGYQEGKTLYGFGYDFRQSNRLKETVEQFAAKLELMYNAAGGKKINIISHSMGGLLVKCFMSLQSNIFERYVKSWIAIAAPFQGAPGYVTSSFLNGMSFVEGWQQNFFVSKWHMHQLLIECPSLYELMACPEFSWEHVPLLEFWKENVDADGNSSVMLESYSPVETVSVLTQALSINKIEYNGVEMPLPFNLEILKWANETRNVLSRAKVPSGVKFYNIYGTNMDTPHSVCYGSGDAPITDIHELPLLLANYICVDGDGTVPVESAKKLKSPSQHNTSIVGHVEASDLVIAHASDSRFWKFTTTHVGRRLAACYELVNVVGVRVDGVYSILDLTEGMIYDVEIVVKLLNNIDIEEVSCSFADTKGRQQLSTKNLKHLPKNENISITVGQFVAHKAILSYNQIKFSMVNKDHEHRKHGLIVIGALVVPKH